MIDRIGFHSRRTLSPQGTRATSIQASLRSLS